MSSRTPHLPPIESWHICIAGFRQSVGQLTGIHRVWRRLGRLRSPTCCVHLAEWNSDFAELAELIHVTGACRVGEPAPRVYVYAYSWGAGRGLLGPRRGLAVELRRRGLEVAAAVLADPVYYSRWSICRWLALWGRPRIVVPYSVLEVWWFRQRNDRPRGHELVGPPWDDGGTIHPAEILTTDHAHADEAPAFFWKCLEVAGETFSSSGHTHEAKT